MLHRPVEPTGRISQSKPPRRTRQLAAVVDARQGGSAVNNPVLINQHLVQLFGGERLIRINMFNDACLKTLGVTS